MSSAVYLKFKKAVPLADWEKFCEAQKIEHSPNTVGGNAFYYNGLFGIQIMFGDSDFSQKELPFHPPQAAAKITVSTFWMGDLDGVAKVAKWILQRWYGSHDADEELKDLMVEETLKG